MKTKKSLRALVPELLSYIQFKYAGNVEYNSKLLNIYEGGLLPYVEESLYKELSPKAYEKAKERIPPINLCRQLIDKLSRVYIESASRTAPIDSDEELLGKYEDWYDVSNTLALANDLVSLNKYCALEPYISQGKPSLRVIPADRFLVWSDNSIDPTDPTVFIKFTGMVKKERPATDAQGRELRDGSKIVRNVQKFTLYSETEILEVDMDGEEVAYQPNLYGRIPFVYIKNSKIDLIPKPDTDMFSMTVLIPKLLADVNYAIQFLSHSIMYGIDVDPQNLDASPDAFWVINSREDSGNEKPQIGTINPEVDSDKVVDLIKAQVSLWLSSKGLKTSSVGQTDPSQAQSGISKLVDESDATSLRKSQIKIFTKAERELWDLTKVLHDSWVAQSLIAGEGKAFTSQFSPSVTFAEQKPVVDTKSMIEDLQGLKKLNLYTPRRALKLLYPTLTDTQVDEVLDEIQDYNNSNTDSDINSDNESNNQDE